MNASHNQQGTETSPEDTSSFHRSEAEAGYAQKRVAIGEALEPDFSVRFARQILELEAINGRGQILTSSAERAKAHLQEVRRRYEESSIHDPRSALSQHVDLSDAEQAIMDIMLHCLVIRSEAQQALTAIRISWEKATYALQEYGNATEPEFNRLRINIICNRKVTRRGQTLVAVIDQLESYIAVEEKLLRHI
jgi:hypothetical protein